MEYWSLCAPWLLLIVCIGTFVALLCRKWSFSIAGLLIVLLGNWYFHVLPLNLINNDDNEGRTIRVLSFNCNLSPKETDYYRHVTDVVCLIDSVDTDIVFLTENFYCNFDTLYHIIRAKYPYRTHSMTPSGNRIYSKFEIKEDTVLESKGIVYGQIEAYGQRLNIYGCHLSSNNYNVHHEYMTPGCLETTQQTKAYLRNVKNASGYRTLETQDLLNHVNGLEDPCVIIGDMNDVAGSPALKAFAKACFKDAWWEKGFGYGATIHNPLPYRIDHILYREGEECDDTLTNSGRRISQDLKLRGIQKINTSTQQMHGKFGLGCCMSDHDALVAEFILEINK